ncbi:hypothetical protein B0H13DRAFT_1854115 [Mycena leptocephala]|nr:hypothetical protein B0H13DRAFT_1854115 [Mycena leptocephala]
MFWEYFFGLAVIESILDYRSPFGLSIGGVISPANPDFSPKELEFQLKATKATLLIAHPDALETSVSAAEATAGLQMKAFSERKLRPGEGKTKLAFLSFSSGTTGTPKAVAIPHIAVIANVLQVAAHSKLNEDYAEWKDRRYRPGDVAIGVLPLYRFEISTAWSSMQYSSGGAQVQLRKHAKKHRTTPHYPLNHPAVKKYDLSGIRYIMIGMTTAFMRRVPHQRSPGAAPLSDEVNEQLFSLFPDAHIGQGYGMTETCTVTSIWSIERKRGLSGGAGRLIPGVVARIVKTDGTLGGYNEVGELVSKAPSNALCYYNNEQAFIRTGDEVKITPDGELWVIDRIKEIMKVVKHESRGCQGIPSCPAELEGTLLDHPDVSDACVVGVPDEYSGELPLAFVALSVDAAGRVKNNPKALQDMRTSILKHVADHKIGYKHLAGGVEFVESIPKTPSGKLLRRVLRERAKELRKVPKAKL